jgi:hypothetical protein
VDGFSQFREPKNRKHVLHFSLLCILNAVAHHSAAEPPKVDWLFPMGAQAGAEITAQIGGKYETWPLKTWTDEPRIQFIADEKKKGFYKVKVSKRLLPGPYLVRFYDANGSAALRVFFVGKAADVLDKEPNNLPDNSQPISELPAIVHGKLDSKDPVDAFKVSLKAGQTFVAGLDAYTAGIPMDALMMLRDARGVKIAFNHDAHSLDPRLVWQCDRDGDYVLQLAAFKFPANASSAFIGAANQVYRLTLTNGPFVRHSLPGGLYLSTKTEVRLMGWNLKKNSLTLPAQFGPEVFWAVEAVNGPLRLPISAWPELTEHEPNDDNASAAELAIPTSVSGIISKPGDDDRFSFTATKEQIFLFDLESSRLGFLLDAKLSIENSKGEEIASNDDANKKRDPQLHWKAPEDGRYFAVVRSVLGKGGSEHYYRLHINRPEPIFSATTQPSYTLKRGESTEVKVKVSFTHTYKGELQLHANSLPRGVTSNSVLIDTTEEPKPKGDKPPPVRFIRSREVKLQLKARKDAPPCNTPFSINLRESDGALFAPVQSDLTSAGINNGVPQGFPEFIIPATPHLWLTVLPPEPPPKEKKEEKKK